jgi:UDP-perosamine 4-acetyltransferase
MRAVVVGAGGHARSILDALLTSGSALEPIALTDPEPTLHGASIEGIPVVGGDELLPRLLGDGVRAASVGVGGVGDNHPRAGLHAHLLALGFQLPPVVHGSAHVAPSARLGDASVVLAGAIVCSGVSIGRDVIVGSGAVVEHCCAVEDHVHVASGSVLGGDVAVATGAHIGLGATILQGRRIGPWAVVGAGAVVTRDVPAGDTVTGFPATARR